MTEHTELLALILPPQGRLVLATAERAGQLPPALVLALEHKAATGSQTVAGRMTQEQVRLLRDGLDLWLRIAERGDVQARPATTSPAHVIRSGVDGIVEVADEGTVAQWLASGIEPTDVDL